MFGELSRKLQPICVMIPGIMSANELIGLIEVAEILDLSRQGAQYVAKTQPDFPLPISVRTKRKTRTWRRGDVERWLRESGWQKMSRATYKKSGEP